MADELENDGHCIFPESCCTENRRTGIAGFDVLLLESQPESNANLLHQNGQEKKYQGIAKALFAYAVQESINHGYDGVVLFKAKTDTLLEYYLHEFGARPVGRYDPFRLVLWEDAAQRLIAEYEVNADE